MIGGGADISNVAFLLEKAFGQKPKKSLDKIKAVAFGAAIQGALLSGVDGYFFDVFDVQTDAIRISFDGCALNRIVLHSGEPYPIIKKIAIDVSYSSSYQLSYPNPHLKGDRFIGIITNSINISFLLSKSTLHIHIHFNCPKSNL